MNLYITANRVICRERVFTEPSPAPDLYKSAPGSHSRGAVLSFDQKTKKCLRITDTLKLGYYIAKAIMKLIVLVYHITLRMTIYFPWLILPIFIEYGRRTIIA